MATETYCDWNACSLRVAAELHVTVNALASNWPPLIAQACRDAAAELKRVFILKGYSPDQLAASEDIRVWNEQLGAFFALCRGAGFGGYDLKAVEYLDCRKLMTEASAIVIDGVATAGGGTEVGGIRHGTVQAGPQLVRRLQRGRFPRGWGW